MLVCRLASRLLTLRPAFRLAYATPASSSGIHGKALATTSFADFTKFVNQNRQELTAEFFSSISRHVGGLINGREKMSFDEAKELLKIFEGLDISSLSGRNTINLLSILRHLKSKGLRSPSLEALKVSLSGRYMAVVGESKEQEVGDLINAYAELSYFRMREALLVADRLLRMLPKPSDKSADPTAPTAPSDRIFPFADHQIAYIFWGMSLRPELSSNELRLRSGLLREVGRQMGAMKLSDVVRIVVNLNRMDLFDLEVSEFAVARQLTDRIVGSIVEFEEKQLYELIRPDNVGRMPGYYRIYEEICNNIFSEIDDRGDTDINHEAVFRVLVHLADKLPLSKLTDSNKKKFFAFLDHYADVNDHDDIKIKQLVFRVRDLVNKNYFAGEQKKQLVKLLAKHDLKLNVALYYDLAVRGYDLAPFAAHIYDYPSTTLKEDYHIRMGIVAYHLSQALKTPDAAAYFESFRSSIVGLLDTPQKFVEFYLRLSRSEVKLYEFHEVFGEYVRQLPNPLETEVEVARYREIYLDYFNGAAKMREHLQFFAKHEAVITVGDVARLASAHVRSDPREIEFRRQVVQLVGRRAYELVDSKEKADVEAAIDFANKYNRFVVGGLLDLNSAALVFRLLHALIAKFDHIAQHNLAGYLLSALEKYVNKNSKNYNVEANYRDLLKHLSSILERIFAKKPHFAANVAKEALRLNLLTKKKLEGVPLEKLAVGFFDRSRLQQIADPAFVPSIERLSAGALEVVFSNPNLESLLVEKEEKIGELLQSCSIHQLTSLLALNVHFRSPASRRLLAQMLNAVVAKLNTLDRIDFIGIFNNALAHGLFTFYQFRKISEKVLELLKGRPAQWSLDVHLEFAKFLVSQPAFNARDYYNELVAYAEKRDDITDLDLEALLLRLASTNYVFRPADLEHTQRILRRNPYTGTFFFLMVENLLEPAARTQAVTSLVERLVERYSPNEQKKEQNFNRIAYTYLKNKYPNETAALSIPETALYNESYFIKPKKPELINTIIALAGGKAEEVTVLGAENYALRINNTVIAFLSTKRAGALYEHDFLRRVLVAQLGEEVKVVLPHSGSLPSSTLEYINKESPQLFDQAEYQKVLAEFKASNRKKTDQPLPDIDA